MKTKAILLRTARSPPCILTRAMRVLTCALPVLTCALPRRRCDSLSRPPRRPTYFSPHKVPCHMLLLKKAAAATAAVAATVAAVREPSPCSLGTGAPLLREST